MMILTWVGVLAGLGGQPAPSATTRLQCDGIGTFPEGQTTTASVFSDGKFASGTATTVAKGKVRERIFVEIANGAARIRMPRSLVPPVHSGDTDGWWSIDDFAETDSTYSGRFRLNPLNKPSIRIDRLSGDLDLKGSFNLSFRGICEKADPTARKF
jgi:hypothetical protein